MLSNLEFKRQFSRTLRKERGFSFSKMDFAKDFINDKRGNMYPVLSSFGNFTESVENGRYRFFGEENACAVRLLGAHHHYASYEIRARRFEKCGFSFRSSESSIDVLFVNSVEGIFVECGEKRVQASISAGDITALIVTSRIGAFDAYFEVDGYKMLVASFAAPDFHDERRDVLCDTVVGLTVGGKCDISAVESYMDTGVSIADIRPIRYENGEILTECGKVYLTASVRVEEEAYQAVFSWIPGNCDFELVGALFFDTGDGILANDIASTVVYDRMAGLWRLYVPSFSHGHIIAYSEFDGDPRFGESYIDVTLMNKMNDGDDDALWLGKSGDEDPCLIYDTSRKKWKMTLCRKSSLDGKYKYFYFESDKPDCGFLHVSHSESGEETGGSIVNIDGEYCLVVGNGFHLRADYRVYKLPNLSTYKSLKCNFDDGGFRGWGTVIPIKRGTREVYYWLTFDRHCGSDYNWSYGNLYCFLAEKSK